MDEVDDILETYGVDRTKLCPSPWTVTVSKCVMYLTIPTAIAFIIAHIIENEKYITMQFFSGMIGCYRGCLGLFKLILINDRGLALNRILKELIERKHETYCVVCTQLYLTRKAGQLRSGKMCFKHTIT